jgi:hypothetical protein
VGKVATALSCAAALAQASAISTKAEVRHSGKPG